MQTLLVENLTKKIAKKTQSTITIGKLNFSFFNTLSLEDIYVSDQHQDTLFMIKKLNASISGINFSSNNFRLKNVELEDAYLKIISYPDSTMNLFTFLDALESEKDKDTLSSSSYFFSAASTKLKNARFVYYDHSKEDVPFGMNYDDMDFQNINADIKELRTIGDTIKMRVENMNCKEKSGFIVNKVNTDLSIGTGSLRLDNVHIALPKSKLNASYLDFKYTPETSAWANFVNAVMLDYLVLPSKINLEEISLFNENLREYNETITVSGHITGVVKNMRCENIVAQLYNNTQLAANISINGLPNIDETFFDANIHSFKTTLGDLEKIKIPNYDEKYLSFPNTLKKLGVFTYKGKYTGFISDFVFYGQFLSSYGDIKTDISVKPTTRTNQLEVSGKIITQDFRIGNLIENKMLGKVSLNVDVVNAMANENYNSYAKIKGEITKIELNNYPYERIKIDGYFADKVFDGKLKMDDENIAFNFFGSFDLHEEIPKTNFELEVKHAQLAPLHLNMLSKDSLSQVSFSIQSNLDGGSIDDATGKLNINNIKYSNSKGNFSTDTILISSSLEKNLRILDINSKFLDAKLKGNFKMSKLGSLPKKILSTYLNIAQFRIDDTINQEQGKLTLALKDINPLLKLFTKGYQISNNAKLSMYYDIGRTNDVKLNFEASLLKYGDKALRNLKLISQGTNQLKTKLSIDRVDLTSSLNILGFSIENSLENNLMNTTLSWGDRDKLEYGGELTIASTFREIGNKQLSINNKIKPSRFSFEKEEWNIDQAQFLIDSTDIAIKEFKIGKKGEYLELSGTLASKKEDAINANLNNFDVKHLWKVFGYKNIDLSGKISGFARYKGTGDSYSIESDLKMPSLSIDNQNLGTLSIHSNWDRIKRALNTKASLSTNRNKTLTLSGNYGINNEILDYTIGLNNFDLSLVKGFTKEYLNDLEGKINGNLQIQGSSKASTLNGNLHFNIPKLTVGETGVTYHLNEKLNIKNNRILFKDFKVLDEKNKAATINGEVLAKIQNASKIALNIKAENLRMLEDSYQTLAYGNASVSGDLDVLGDFEHIRIRGNIKADNNSKIIIPFDSASEVGDNDFITFINPADSIKYYDQNDVLFIPTGAKKPMTFNLNFNINPTSEIQVLFESKSGSVLKSRGTADLQISRDRNGRQIIIGGYTVSQGTFFYSLESIVNKKFILQEGGSIRWNGAPEKAYLNLNAVYQLKASIAPLLSQESGGEKSRPTTVLCKTQITGQLEDPKLTFSIEFPNVDSTTEGSLKSALQTTDITKQVLSLLVFNRFTSPEYNPNIVGGASNQDALSVTTSELLSSQISNILSQLSEDVNIGFIYRPGDDLTKEELGLAISTELLQNRVVISGNLGFSSQNEANRFKDFSGDVDFDIKLNKRGNLRLRFFSHSRDDLYYSYYENKKNTIGSGIIYNEDFDTFKELLQKYKEKLGWGKKKKKK